MKLTTILRAVLSLAVFACIIGCKVAQAQTYTYTGLPLSIDTDTPNAGECPASVGNVTVVYDLSGDTGTISAGGFTMPLTQDDSSMTVNPQTNAVQSSVMEYLNLAAQNSPIEIRSDFTITNGTTKSLNVSGMSFIRSFGAGVTSNRDLDSGCP